MASSSSGPSSQARSTPTNSQPLPASQNSAISVETAPTEGSDLSQDKSNVDEPLQSLSAHISRVNIDEDGEAPDSPTFSSEESSEGDSNRLEEEEDLLYDVADEVPPKEKFHDPAFQQMLTESKQLMSEMAQVLSSSPLNLKPSTRTRENQEKAIALSKYKSSAELKIGLVGAAGVGKSSLINSLLDIPALAYADDGGSACTCVVTEYHYRNSPDFTIEIEYFNMDDVRRQFRELVRAYRRYHLQQEFGTDEKDQGALQDGANIARGTFEAAFPSEDINALLLGESDEDVVSQLLIRAENACPEIARDGEPTQITGLDASKCSQMLMETTAQSDMEFEPAKWPFIRKAKVFLRAHLLSHGLVLVDLPGLCDVNLARVKITERNLKYCGAIFAVCEIGRALSNDSVEKVFSLVQRAENLFRVGIICTKSDIIQGKEPENTRNGAELEKVKDMRSQIWRLAREQKQLELVLKRKQRHNQELSPNERATLDHARERLLVVMAALGKLEFELKDHIMKTRNKKIESRLRVKYENRLQGCDVSVFCISNTDYTDYRNKPKDDFLPYLRRSQIREVRMHCISLIADKQFRDAQNYMEDRIGSFVKSVALWVDAVDSNVNQEQRGKVSEALAKLEYEFQKNLVQPAPQISELANSMKQQYIAHIDKVMEHSTNEWIKSASAESEKWSKWKHQTYAAFCRRYGEFRFPGQGKLCWNDEAMQSMFTAMKGPRKTFRTALRALESAIKLLIELTFKKLGRLLALTKPCKHEQMKLLESTLQADHRLLKYDLREKFEQFEKKIDLYEIDAFTGIRTSLTGEYLEDAYEDCNLAAGTGSDKYRKKVITNQFSDRTLIDYIRSEAQDRFEALANDLQVSIKDLISSMWRNIKNNLDTLRHEDIAQESFQDPEFRRRVKDVVTRAKAEVEEIRATIQRDIT